MTGDVLNPPLNLKTQTYETTLELDSHADTYVLGWHALITLDHNRPVAVMGYDESLGTKTYKTVSGVVAHTDPKTGRMLHLIILSIRLSMSHTLTITYFAPCNVA